MPTEIRVATPDEAPELLRVIRDAFSARPPLDPPAEALSDTVDDVRRATEDGLGVVVESDEGIIACLLVDIDGDTATLRRVSVLPGNHRTGIGFDMVATTLLALSDMGLDQVELTARPELPKTVAWWERAGFEKRGEHAGGWTMGRTLPKAIAVPDAESMRALGRRLADVLQAGDVIVASGDLGAGKTTLTQGIGAGLGVDGSVISPTFMISRIHESRTGRPPLVHVDAYRLSSPAELRDIDLQDTQPTSVTLVEWGRGLAEWLSPDRLEVHIQRSDDPSEDERTVYLLGIGKRWKNLHKELEA